MSQAQLDSIIADIQACFGAWTADTPMAQMRNDWDALFASSPSPIDAAVESITLGGVAAAQVRAPGVAGDRAILYLHGGGYVFGSSRSHRGLAEQLSASANATVFVLDYRLAPEHPYPAALDDAVAAYRDLLARGQKPARLVIAGDSAGGGLTLATLQVLRQHQLPPPACATVISPWADLEATGDSVVTRDALDPIVHKPMLDQLARLYVPEGSLHQPLVSPLHGNLTGLPPLLIQVGSRETLFDDAVRVDAAARRQGVAVELDVWQGMIHVWHLFASRLDEAVQALDRVGAFIGRHTG